MQKISLFIISMMLVEVLQSCGKIEEPIVVTPEPSKVTFGRFAIEEFWPLSEGKIDENTKTITVKVPSWAKLSDLSVYSQLNLGSENPASVTTSPSLADKVDFTNLKTIKITDGQGKQVAYTLKIEKPEPKLVTSIKGEDEFSFSYDGKGKMIQIKSFNQNSNVNGGKVSLHNITYNANDLISFSTQNPDFGQVYTTADNNHTMWLNADEKKRIKNLVYLAEETVRLEYDIANNKVILYFRINPMGGESLALRRITFSNFDGSFSPMASLPLQETYWSVNLIYALYYYYYNASTTIAPKLLLSNPKTILIEELKGDKKTTTLNLNYEYQNGFPVKYTVDSKTTVIFYQ